MVAVRRRPDSAGVPQTRSNAGPPLWVGGPASAFLRVRMSLWRNGTPPGGGGRRAGLVSGQAPLPLLFVVLWVVLLPTLFGLLVPLPVLVLLLEVLWAMLPAAVAVLV